MRQTIINSDSHMKYAFDFRDGFNSFMFLFNRTHIANPTKQTRLLSVLDVLYRCCVFVHCRYGTMVTGIEFVSVMLYVNVINLE